MAQDRGSGLRAGTAPTPRQGEQSMEVDMELSVETARAVVERSAHAEAVRILELQ
jgi:hypothetical protein